MKRFLFVAAFLAMVLFLVGVALVMPAKASANTCVQIYEGGRYICRPAFFNVGSAAYVKWQAETKARAAAISRDYTSSVRSVAWAPAPRIPAWLWDIISKAAR